MRVFKKFLLLAVAAGCLDCSADSPSDLGVGNKTSAVTSTSPSKSPADDPDSLKSCRTDVQVADATPAKLIPVTTLQDRVSFLNDVRRKPEPPAPASPFVPKGPPADVISRQNQYLQQWHAIMASVSDPVERETRRLALKQSLLPPGKD